jgi:nitrogen PTS system EIIA component
LGMIAQMRSPLAFGAIDGQDVDLVFALFLPKSEQLGALACVARKLRADQDVSRMRQARSAIEVYEAAVA